MATLHAFDGEDGSLPNALVLGSDGNFYGTTIAGGANGVGSVFQITPAGGLTTLYSFTGNSDGDNPYGALVEGSDGSFYGTTYLDGAHNNGTVFRITPAGLFTTLYSFNGSDGSEPEAGLLLGSDGNLYGTTSLGGTDVNGRFGYGTIFQITQAGVLTTLYAFPQIGSNGERPTAALAQGSDGDFYGTTSQGGSSGGGTVFRITPAGVLTTLYSFPVDSVNYESSLSALVQGNDGNFYGTTSGIGMSGDYGTIFQITPAGVLTTLYSFGGGSDGDGPNGLIQGSDGNFYGTTIAGGSTDVGTVFQITPAGVLTSLHSFHDSDGEDPSAGLVQGSDGNFYGTTSSATTLGISTDQDVGTVFQLTLHPGFFTGESMVGNGVYYLAFSTGNYFGYYSYLADPNYLYHFDLGYEYVFNANDGKDGVYFYDFKSNDFFYTSPGFPFPYLYDFGLNSTVYYYPDPTAAGRYDTNGVRYFYVFRTGKIISK